MPVFLPAPPPIPRKPKRSFGGFLENLVGDVPQLARALAIDLPVAAARGTARSAADIYRFATPFQAGANWRALDPTATRLASTTHAFAQGIENFIPFHQSLEDKLLGSWAHKILVGKDKHGWHFWYDHTDPQDTTSATDAWYSDPLVGILNVAPFVGGATRLASVSKLASSVRAANPEIDAGTAWRLASVETRHPGTLAAHEIKGGLSERQLKIDLGAKPPPEDTLNLEPLPVRAAGWGGLHGTPLMHVATQRVPKSIREVVLAQSGSPIGRGIEKAYDLASQKFPGRLSQEARAARYEARQQRETLRQKEAGVKGLSQPISDAAYSYGQGPASKTWGFLRGKLERNPTAT